MPEHERIQIDTSVQTFNQEMYDECITPTSPSSSNSVANSDDLNSIASSGFDHLPRAPAKSLILKCTNPDQLSRGSCYF